MRKAITALALVLFASSATAETLEVRALPYDQAVFDAFWA